MATVPAQITSCPPIDALRDLCAAFYALRGRWPTRSEAKVLWAGAAHETADFQRMPNNGVGGVKAGARYAGAVAIHTTHEIVGGVSRQIDQPFRAYASVRAGFFDWLVLLSTGYSKALAGAAAGDPEAYVRGLQEGWGTHAHYFTASPESYLAGVWARLRAHEALHDVPWDELTTRRVPTPPPPEDKS